MPPEKVGKANRIVVPRPQKAGDGGLILQLKNFMVMVKNRIGQGQQG
jgi:hypothetical protein